MRIGNRLRDAYRDLLMHAGGMFATEAVLSGFDTRGGDTKAAIALFFLKRSMKVGTTFTDEEARRLAVRSIRRLAASSKLTVPETAAVYFASDPLIPVSRHIDRHNVPAFLARAARKLSDDDLEAFDLVRTMDGGLVHKDDVDHAPRGIGLSA